MRIKRKNGLKVAAITIALLLCLALAVGITGAWYQAKRQATGTLSMDQGIIIDYNGFDKTAAEDWATWTRGVTLPLFKTNDAQPGQNIPVNPAGIRANEKSVNFYARVKLSYKFYNGETPVELADATKLIKTSSSFWANSWVDGGSSDGYYYYATGSTLNKFAKTSTTFVDLFAADAKFIIEGAGFTGADNDGESGGFKIDDTTSINKIEVYLTLETLQGDATAEQAKALGWKIVQTVDFAKVKDNATFVQTGNYSEGAAVTNYTDTAEIEEMQNVQVTINDQISSPLNEIKFSYGKETILEFDSSDVEYIQLKYKDGTNADGSDKYKLSEPFYDTQETGNAKITVTADENEEVGGYVVGWFSSKEYTGFVYSTRDFSNLKTSNDFVIENTASNVTSQPDNCYSIIKYFGNEKDITVKDQTRVRQRDLEVKITGWTSDGYFNEMWVSIYYEIFNNLWLWSEMLPLTDVETGDTYTTLDDFLQARGYSYWENSGRTEITLRGKAYVDTSNIFYGTKKTITQINPCTFGVFASKFNAETLEIPGSIELVTKTWHSDIQMSIFGISGYRDIHVAMQNTSLKSISLGEGITVLPKYVFSNLTKLGSINLPDSLTNIEEYAFYGCSGLTSITIPDSVTSIGDGAFSDCEGLTSIHIGAGIQEVSWLPSDVSNIKITISKDNPYLAADGKAIFAKSNEGLSVLQYISANTTYDIPAAVDGFPVTSIRNYAFSYCSLTSITIPDSVTSIGEYAFQNCSGLTSVTIGNSVTSIGSRAFANCSSLTSITIPDSVISIGDGAFWSCSGLSSVIIGNSVNSIGSNAFQDCSGLTSVTIGNSVTSIGDCAFYGCRGLTSITIPDSVTSIGDFAFSDCEGLTEITVKAINPPTLSSYSVFPNEVRTIYVPARSVEAYKAADGWKDYAIQAISE